MNEVRRFLNWPFCGQCCKTFWRGNLEVGISLKTSTQKIGPKLISCHERFSLMIKIQIKFMEFQYNYFYSFGALLNFGKNSNLHISSSKKFYNMLKRFYANIFPKKRERFERPNLKLLRLLKWQNQQTPRVFKNFLRYWFIKEKHSSFGYLY